MDKELFDEIFDFEILPFIREIDENNSKIQLKDIDNCKSEIYKEYVNLKNVYKGQIFGKDSDKELLDRHKIAACICGAFLKVSVFNKSALVDYIKKEKCRVEVYFFYVNELVAFYAATKYLSFFMVSDNINDDEMVRKIVQNFPKAPEVANSKKGIWTTILFNLAQIKDEEQIGLEHFDMYSYAMQFYWFERAFKNS